MTLQSNNNGYHLQKIYVKTLTSKQNIGILLLAADAIAASFLLRQKPNIYHIFNTER